MPSVRTRFAPSPTGALHVGGVRTALFSYLLRPPPRRAIRPSHRGYRPPALDPSVGRRNPRRAALARDRLGRGALLPDRAPRSLPRARVERLLRDGHAYRCTCTPEELDAKRKAAMQRRRQRRLRPSLPARRRPGPGRGRPAAIRFAMPTRRRGGDRRPGQGSRRRSRTRRRRLRHRPLRRLADVQPRRDRRRRGHGDQPRHPRRRPADEHAEADPALPRARCRGAELRAPAAGARASTGRGSPSATRPRR